MTLDQALLLYIAERMEAQTVRLESWEGFLMWVIVAGLCSAITCGILLWMQVMRGKSQKNIL